MSQLHPYRKFQIPPNVPFELKPAPGKGWGLFATRNIKRMDTILDEIPLFMIPKRSQDITEMDVANVVHSLSASDQFVFECLRDNGSEPFKTMLLALKQNFFAVPNSPPTGVYILSSRFNHSCVPNCFIIPRETNMVTYASQDIAQGDELKFCYNSELRYQVAEERLRTLLFKHVDCKACEPGSYRDISDFRRTLIRALEYLSLGIDKNAKQGTPFAIKHIDPELRKKAESGCMTLTSRFIYDVFIVALMEAEGLQDPIKAGDLLAQLEAYGRAFQTSRNAYIAKLAMSQPNGCDKFLIALRFWGRSDLGDEQAIAGSQRSAMAMRAILQALHH
ncbi:SET domain-containing protein [Microthyrium microscopicum]|uniref:SET domain-containing protein n=1 Tax=Microthyrium microscopicum TaxID=703497 RepID=A0A6A6UHM5_9PEZI|nr:SET domain-containing protein [Microthyrium microscopicum]